MSLTAADQPVDPRVITRSEERMAVGTRVEATERVTVHKYIVTEQVTETITLRRKEIRVEHQPLHSAALPPVPSDVAFTDEVEEIVLYAEVPVVQTRVVPVEIVRLSKHTVTREETLATDLAREHIHIDHTGPDGPAPPLTPHR